MQGKRKRPQLDHLRCHRKSSSAQNMKFFCAISAFSFCLCKVSRRFFADTSGQTGMNHRSSNVQPLISKTFVCSSFSMFRDFAINHRLCEIGIDSSGRILAKKQPFVPYRETKQQTRQISKWSESLLSFWLQLEPLFLRMPQTCEREIPLRELILAKPSGPPLKLLQIKSCPYLVCV